MDLPPAGHANRQRRRRTNGDDGRLDFSCRDQGMEAVRLRGPSGGNAFVMETQGRLVRNDVSLVSRLFERDRAYLGLARGGRGRRGSAISDPFVGDMRAMSWRCPGYTAGFRSDQPVRAA